MHIARTESSRAHRPIGHYSRCARLPTHSPSTYLCAHGSLFPVNVCTPNGKVRSCRHTCRDAHTIARGIIAMRSEGNGVRALMRRRRFDPTEESRNRALSLLRRGWFASVPPAAAAAAVGRLDASIGSDERESRFQRVPQPQLQSFPVPPLSFLHPPPSLYSLFSALSLYTLLFSIIFCSQLLQRSYAVSL